MNTLALREVHLAEESLRRYARLCNKNYMLARVPSQHRFIHIAASLDERVVDLYCDADKLLQRCTTEAEALPVEIIDHHLLVGLARRYFSCHEIAMPVSSQSIKSTTVVGMANTTEISYPLVSMAPTEAFIWCALKDIALPVLPTNLNGADWSRLVLSMKIDLGNTLIAWNDLRQLNSGDLILIEHATCNIIIANRITLKCRIEEDDMVIESMEENNVTIMDDSIGLIHDNQLNMANLELNVDFLLDERNMTLAELQTLQINDHIPLTCEGSKVNVSLRVGRTIVASGELVRVNDQLAVEIDNINGTV